MMRRRWERIVIDGVVWPYEVHRDTHRVRRQAGAVPRGAHLYRVRGGVLKPSRPHHYVLSMGAGNRVGFSPKRYLADGRVS